MSEVTDAKVDKTDAVASPSGFAARTDFDFIQALAQKIVGKSFDDDEAASIDLAKELKECWAAPRSPTSDSTQITMLGLVKRSKYVRFILNVTDGRIPTQSGCIGDLCIGIMLPKAPEDDKTDIHIRTTSGTTLTTLERKRFTNFLVPINCVAGVYNEVVLVQDGKRYTEPIKLMCVYIMDLKLRNAFMRGSKRLLYRLTESQEEEFCMFRGQFLPKSARYFIF